MARCGVPASSSERRRAARAGGGGRVARAARSPRRSELSEPLLSTLLPADELPREVDAENPEVVDVDDTRGPAEGTCMPEPNPRRASGDIPSERDVAPAADSAMASCVAEANGSRVVEEEEEVLPLSEP